MPAADVDRAAVRKAFETDHRSVKVIAAEFGMLWNTVYLWAKAGGWVRPSKRPTGQEGNHRRGLKNDRLAPGAKDRRPGRHKPLSKQAQIFIAEYLTDFNGARAARAAGHAEKYAKCYAVELLARDDIKAEIDRQIADREFEDLALTRRLVIRELSRITNADMRNVASWDEAGKITWTASDELTDAAAAGIASIQQTKDGFKITMHAKLPALIQLAQHVGIGRQSDPEEMDNTVVIKGGLPDAEP